MLDVFVSHSPPIFFLNIPNTRITGALLLWVLGSEFKSMTVQQALYYLSLLLAITHIFVIVRGVYIINKDIKIKPYIWTWG